MSKIKDLELKKLLKELEYIESDFEYKNEVISEADTEFINSINSFLNEHPELKKIYDEKVTKKINDIVENSNKEIEKSENSESQEEQSPESELNSDIDELPEVQVESESKKISQIKKLYREIVKLTHPDLIKNESRNDLYIKATKYYDEGHKIGIYAICDVLNIPFQIEEEDYDLIKNRIVKYKEKIVFLESTFTWKWFYTENPDEKKQILLTYIKIKIK
jgi:hypothetical protein